MILPVSALPSVCLLFAVACAAPDAFDTASREGDAMDVYEAVFRFQLGEPTEPTGDRRDYCFLSLPDRQDPPAGFLARFGDDSVLVAPSSLATIVGHGIDCVRHRVDGGRGFILSVGSIHWLSVDMVEVEGEWYRGTRAASGHRFRVQRRLGRWAVVDEVMLWIS